MANNAAFHLHHYYYGGRWTVQISDVYYTTLGQVASALKPLQQDLLDQSSQWVTRLYVGFEQLNVAWDHRDWFIFCRAVQIHLPKLKEVEIRGGFLPASSIDDVDGKLAILLRHLPPTLLKFKIRFYSAELPRTFKQLGLRLKSLQELSLVGRHQGCFPAWSAASGNHLVESLLQLPCLQKVDLVRITLPIETWKPLLKVIGSNDRLLDVSASSLQVAKHYDSEETAELRGARGAEALARERRDLTRDETACLQFGPILNRAKTKYLSGKIVTHQDFVHALIYVKESVDCLYYLLSSTDPTFMLSRPRQLKIFKLASHQSS